MLEVSRGYEEGLDVTRIHKVGSPVLSVTLSFPHSPEGFSDEDGDMAPTQTVHLLEHVACCGGAEYQSAADHRRIKDLYAASTNAFTDFTIPGSNITFKGEFHPTGTPEAVLKAFIGQTAPALRPVDVEQQKAIVTSELQRYLADPIRQVLNRRYYGQQLLYGNEKDGLRRLPEIAYGHMIEFISATIVRPNARVILAGDLEQPKTEEIGQVVIEAANQLGPGTRFVHKKAHTQPKAAWHEDVPGIENSVFEASLVWPDKQAGNTAASDVVIQTLVSSMLNNFPGKESSYFWAMRELGLSYGPNSYVYRNENEWGVFVSDSVRPDDVKVEVDLLKTHLLKIYEQIASSEQLFEELRNWCFLQREMYEPSAADNAQLIVAALNADDCLRFTPADVKAAFGSIDHHGFVADYGKILEGLMDSPTSFMNLNSYGQKPAI